MEIRNEPLKPIEKRQLPEERKYVDLGSFYNFSLSE
jgi:hypothetical protein